MTGRTPAEVEAAAVVLRRLAMPRDRDDEVEWVAEEALAAADAAAPPPVGEAAVPAASRWSCGRCDSFAARGFDDGQITEHHHTCRHAGVGAGPQGEALAAVLELHSRDSDGDCSYCWALVERVGGALMGGDCDWPCPTVRAITGAGAELVMVTTHAGQHVRSDLTGLGAREAGLTVYPATDARSTDQDVAG